MRVGRRAKREGYLLHLGNGHNRAEDAAHESKELNLARDEHLQRGGVAARDVVVLRQHTRLDAAVRRFANGFPHLD